MKPPSKKPLILLGLNEINFDCVKAYTQKGKLKNFAKVIEENGISLTTSEEKYEELEPWIQWVTAQTGMSYADHRVFRLGDIVNTEHPQIWEELESKGIKVGAVCPMNAANRCKNPAFFLPDPWTKTKASGGSLLRNLSDAVSQAVNDNAQARISKTSLWHLLKALVYYARVDSLSSYFKNTFGSLRNSWRRALVLDRLVADVFIKEWHSKKPGFSSLFLNSAAHIQHHYMFSSKVYRGEFKNPTWYISKKADPLFEIFDLYDRVLGTLLKTNARVLLLTGLHQDPCPQSIFYYRLRNHSEFLNKLNMRFLNVKPRMSRDFLVEFGSETEAQAGVEILKNCKAEDGQNIFTVDNRGLDVFVELSYPNEIKPGFKLVNGPQSSLDFFSEVAFVAIKNGIHNSLGYFADTAARPNTWPGLFELKRIPSIVFSHFDLDWNIPRPHQNRTGSAAPEISREIETSVQA